MSTCTTMLPRGTCLLMAAITLTCILIFSCNSDKKISKDYTLKTDSILQHTDDYLNSGEIRRAITYLDSAYADFKDAGPLDKWRRYHCLKNYYLNYDVSPAKAKLYVDSMFLVLKGVESNYRSAYASSFFAKGDVLRAQYRFSEAFGEYFRGREYARKYLDSCEHAGFTNRLGLIRYAQSDYRDAINYLRQALAENSKCDTGRDFESRFILPQSILNTIAFSYEQVGMPDSSIYFYEKGIKFVRDNLKFHPRRKAYMDMALGVLYGNLGGQYAKLKHYNIAESYLKRSIAINDRKGYAVEDASTAKYKLASMYLEMNRINDAKVYIAQLDADLAARQGNNRGRSSMEMSLARLKAQYLQVNGDNVAALSQLSDFEKKRDSALLSERMERKADADASFREAEKTFMLELTEREARSKNRYILALIIISLLVVAILVIVWWNLKRSRRHIGELSRLNKKILEQNEYLRHSTLVLEQNQEENSKLLKLVAHDLRNPIGAVYMSASMLLHQDGLKPKGANLVEIIKRTAKDCLALVDDLLKTKEVEKTVNKQPEDMLHILKFCIGQLQHKADEKQQHIELSGVSVIKEVDVARIWRVFGNLIGNAIKFSQPGATIWITVENKEGFARVSVRDEGVGIPEHLHEKIFEASEEAQREGTAGEETHGLGLLIARQIVQQHDGKLWLESGNGTTIFYVDLP